MSLGLPDEDVKAWRSEEHVPPTDVPGWVEQGGRVEPEFPTGPLHDRAGELRNGANLAPLGWLLTECLLFGLWRSWQLVGCN